MRYFFSLLTCLLCTGVLAVPLANTPKPNVMHCPTIAKIYHSQQNHWGTSDASFRSLDTSFSHHLDTFLGAQWQGINVGYILCVYKPVERNLFKVTLLYGPLTLQPTSQKWQKNKEGNYNCISTNVNDCPFTPKPAEKSTKSLYQQVLDVNSGTNDNAGF